MSGEHFEVNILEFVMSLKCSVFVVRRAHSLMFPSHVLEYFHCHTKIRTGLRRPAGTLRLVAPARTLSRLWRAGLYIVNIDNPC